MLFDLIDLHQNKILNEKNARWSFQFNSILHKYFEKQMNS